MAFSSNSYQYQSPSYQSLHTFFDNEEDYPGPRCGHTLTAIYGRLIMFGGITAVDNRGCSISGISLQGVTNAVHCFDVYTRKWRRVYPDGEAPSPRAGHAAASIENRIFIQGGIGPFGPCTGDLYILYMTRYKFVWQRVVVQGLAPGPRYGHVMGYFANHRIVIFGGKSGFEILGDTWALDTTRPFVWERLNPFGNLPSARMYASASIRNDGYFVLCGGRDYFGEPLGDAYALEMLYDGRWMWTSVPGVAPSQRCQHTSVFVQPRLHVIGGVLGGARRNAESAVAVFDTSSGVWLDRNGPGTSNRGSNGQYLNQLMRCRHAAASVGGRIYVHGGLGGPGADVLLNDLLVSDDDISQPSSSEPANISLPRSSSESSTDRLVEAPVNLPTVEAAFYDCVAEGYTRLQQRTETVRNRGGLVRQLSLDRFENERRGRSDMMNYSYTPQFIRKKSTQDLVKKVISTLWKPHKNWQPPANRNFFLSYLEVEELCNAAEQIFIQEPTVLQLKVPIKVFGDLHGQFGDLMRLFYEFGEPSSTKGDIASIDYLFLGDYVDRGKHSLETIILLIALKIEYPRNIHLIRGNHESNAANSIHGFKGECIERMGQGYGDQAWKRINRLFDHLPLAALIEKKVFCMHGGIGRSVQTVEQVANIRRPLPVDYENESMVVKDLLWSDPTDNDSILGIQGNCRGTGVVSFGPDIVEAFCERNNLDMIIRGHECVMDGFERFAQGRLMTVFSAPNYCGHIQNAGAVLVIGRDWVIYPKLLHPDSPPLSSSEIPSMQERSSQGSSFPVGGGSNPGFERGSTSSQT